MRERDLVKRDGCFIVEGRIALERLAAHGRFGLESVLVAEGKVETVAGLAGDTPVYSASQPVMDAVAGFHIHRGVLALARRGAPIEATALLRDASLVIVLVGLSNHDNVGACFRNAAAFGADAVLLDASSCDPLYRKAIRVSSGACLSLPFAQGGTGQDILDALGTAGFETWGLSPRGEEELFDIAPPKRVALVLGAEGPGLPEALLKRTRQVRIPMKTSDAALDSLNVATAGAIALAHVFSSRERRH